ncbi:hypothetical protein LX69_03498 [Breznakibacter xylanolyticus]|uniref:Uncharacterized protein n=1 Tax=Breznakibacter xylanolyticus TaxID=990 RepID=A0A2W7MQI7_9BACT|nr:hypothetical protein [Breznakibacter xylanolyticus]PZX09833.1 hypothetical protein LX69_03498 [Breznakibacter xylanolyticus]
MGKQKKKKGTPERRSLKSYMAITKTYSDEFTQTAHKFMRLIGLEPSDFDVLTKRTKQELMRIRHTPYKIYAQKGGRVPEAYVRFFNACLFRYEKQSYYGDPQYGITYYEYVTHGLTFIFSIRNYDQETGILPDQYPLLEKIKKPLVKYTQSNEVDHYSIRTTSFLNFLYTSFSQPNYRYYTGEEQCLTEYMKGRIKNEIRISSIEPERRTFVIDKEVRPSYRLGIYRAEIVCKMIEPTWVELPMVLLEAEDSRSVMAQLMGTRLTLPVYIQSHALHRMGERLDCFDNYSLNQVFTFTFMEPRCITATNGQRLIVAIDFRGKTIGYFPMAKVNGAVLLLSFLPLSSPITPEGSILQKELGLQFDDIKFIGLDKLSYYIKTNFNANPPLQKALKKANMWHLTDFVMKGSVEKKEDRIIMNYLTRNRAMAADEACV